MTPESQYLTSISDTDVLNFQHDTQQRLNNLFGTTPDLGAPVGEIGAVQPGQNINIDSEEFQLKKYDELIKNLRNQYPTNFATPTDILVPQEQTKRYIDEKYGFRLGIDNEDFYADLQHGSFGGQLKEIGKAIFAKLPLYTVTKLGSGIGYLAGLINPVNWFQDNYIAAAADNGIAKFFETFEDNLKNDWLTTYQKTAYQNEGFFTRALNDQTFWTEDLVDGAAFMASAFVPGAIVSKLGLGVKVAQALGAGRALTSSNAFISGMGRAALGNADFIMTTALNTASESMFEAKEVRDNVYKNLISQGISHEEAESKAAEKAKNSFLSNMVMLSLSNAWETSLFFKALGKSPKRIGSVAISPTLEATVDGTTKGFFSRPLGFYSKKAAEGIFMEGFYEENAQLAVQRINQGEGKYGKYFTDEGFLSYAGNVMNQTLGQGRDALLGEDAEASVSIGLGALIGGLFGTGTSILNKEHRIDDEQAKSVVDSLNKAKYNWLKFTDIYDKDGNIDRKKVAATLMTQYANAAKLDEISDLTDENLINLAKKQAFSDLVYAHLNNGTFDKLTASLNQVPTLSDEELLKLNFDPSQNTKDKVSEYINYANALRDVKNSLDKTNIQFEGNPDIANARYNALLELGAKNAASLDELGNVDVLLSKANIRTQYDSLSDGIVDNLNYLKTKIDIMNKFISEVKDEGKKAEYEKRRNRYQKEYDTLEKDAIESIQSKKDSNGYYNYQNTNKTKTLSNKDYVNLSVKKARIEVDLEENTDLFNTYLGSYSKFEKDYNKEVQAAKESINQAAEKLESIQKEKQAELEKTQPKQIEAPVTQKEQIVADNTTPEPTKEEKKELLETDSFENIIASIPKGNKIEFDIFNVLSDRNTALTTKLLKSATTEAEKDAIYEQGEKIWDILNNQKVVVETGTLQGKMEVEPETKPEGIEPDPDTQGEIIDSPVASEPDGFNAESNDVLDVDSSDLESAIAWRSSNKTITQEEIFNKGRATGKIDEDPYKQFTQTFIRKFSQNAANFQSNFAGKVIKDARNLPHNAQWTQFIENNPDKLGSVLVITDKQGNVLYFNQDLSQWSTEPNNISPVTDDIPGLAEAQAEERERLGLNVKPLVFAIDKDNWFENNFNERVAIASREMKLDENFIIQHFVTESKERQAARKLNDQGKEVDVNLVFASPGILRRTTKPVAANKVITGDYSIFIPKLVEKYDPEHPELNKYVPIRPGLKLVNGGAYAVVNNEYIRLIPNKLGETTLYNDIMSLLKFNYNDFDTANGVRDYLNGLLFYGRSKRPIFNIVSLPDGTFNIVEVENNERISIDRTAERLLNERFSIRVANLEDPSYTYYRAEGNTLTAENKTNYKQFVVDNSTTTTIPYDTEQGPQYMGINNYLTFKFRDSLQAMQDKIDNVKVIDNTPIAQPASDQVNDNSSLTFEPVKRKRGRPKKKTDDDLNIDKLNALKTDEPVLETIDNYEISEVERMFGYDVLVRVGEIANSNAWAEWTTAGITLVDDAPKGTAYHEAWHNFSQLYLTINQKDRLYNEVRNKNINFKTRDGRKLNTNNASDLDIEEFVADDFRDYVLSEGKSVLTERPVRNSIFRRVLDFLRRLFFGGINIEKLYADLYAGRINQYTPSIKNARWGRLSAAIYDQEGNEILDSQWAVYFRNVMDYFTGQVLKDKNIPISEMINNPKLAGAIYNNVYSRLSKEYYNPLVDKYENGSDDIDEEFLDNFEKLLTNENNWTEFIKYYSKYSKIGLKGVEAEINTQVFEEDYKEQDEENPKTDETDDTVVPSVDEIEHVENDNAGNKLFDRAGNEVNPSVGASIEVRSLIRMLPRVIYSNNSFTIAKDIYGFPELCEYGRVFNNIAVILSGSQTYEEMYERLFNQENQKRIPEITELIKHLPSPYVGALSDDEVKRIAAFKKDFGRYLVDIFSTRISTEGEAFYMQETRRNRDAIIKQFSNNFMAFPENDPLVEEGYLMIDENARIHLNPNRVLNFSFDTLEEQDLFLSLLGMKFSPETLDNLDTELKGRGHSILSFLNILQTVINKRHQLSNINQLGYKIYNPIIDLRQDLRAKINGENKLLNEGLGKLINYVLDIETKYNPINTSLSYQTSEGESIYALMLPNWLNTNTSYLNTARSYEDIINNPETQHLNFNNNPNVFNSVILRSLYNLSNGQRIQGVNILVNNYNGLKTDNKDGTITGSSTSSLNIRQKIIMDINSLLKEGAIEIMRTEASNSAYSIRVNKYASSGDKLPVAIKEMTVNWSSPTFHSIMRGYLKDELYRIKNADNITLPGYPKESAKKFHIFRDILTLRGSKAPNELKEKMLVDLESLSPKEVFDKHAKSIESAINAFFEKELDSTVEFIEDEGVDIENISPSLRKYSFKALMRSFVANSFILNVEYTKLFNGDLAYIDNTPGTYKDYFKRSKADTSTGNTPITDNVFISHMQATSKETFAGFLGVDNLNDYKTVRSAVIKEDNRESSYVTSGIMQRDLKAVNPNITEAEINKIISGYKGLKVGDGQGHITLDFYRQFLKSVNNWSDAQELAYKYELAKFRFNNRKLSNNYTQENASSDEGFIKQYESRYGDYNAASHFPPLKAQYAGPMKAVGTAPMIMDKFSLAPLIPSVIKGTKWESQNLDMVRNGYGYTKFESGTKKFPYIATQRTSTGDLNLSGYTPQVLFLSNLKEQILTNPNIKEEATFGSQIRKLIFANRFSKGIASKVDVNRYERYKSLLRSIHNVEKQKLYVQLGLNENNGKVTVDNTERFLETLKKQAELRDLNDNIQDYLQYDKSGNLIKYPLETALNKRAIRDLLMGIIDRKARIQKINGDMAIQVSSSGFEDADFTNATSEDISKYGTNGLRFYELEYTDGKPIKTKAIQVKVALVGGFENLLNKIHPDGERIRSLERLNELLRDENWVFQNRKAITMIGYRIPTQGPNSMEVMEIAEFLPSDAGSILIPPAEIVGKAGSDFDIDKMSIFRPTLDRRGNVLTKSLLAGLEQELEDLRKNNTIAEKLIQKYNVKSLSNVADLVEVDSEVESEEERKLVKQIKNLKESQKNIYINELMDLYSEILTDPTMFTQLITPNSTDLIKPSSLDLAKKLKREPSDKTGYKGTQILIWRNSMRKFVSLLSGKKLLGIFATNNTFSQLIQQTGVEMNDTYNVIRRRKLLPRKVMSLLLPPEYRNANRINGKIQIGNKYSAGGVLKQEYFSQLINGTVDVASDDFLGYINLSRENAGEVAYLINEGADYENIMYFMNQPVMLEYYSRLRTSSSYKSDIQAGLLEELLGVNLRYEDDNGNLRLDFNAFHELGNQLMSQIPANSYFNLEFLKGNIKPARDAKKFILDPKNKKVQAMIFAYFLQVKEQAGLFNNFRSTLSFDTSKINTPTEAYSLSIKQEEVSKNNLFAKSEIDKIANDSIVSHFDNRQLITNITNQIMPTGYAAVAMNKIANIVASNPYMTRAKLKKLTNTLENDWVEYVVKNLGKYNGRPIYEYFNELLTGPNNIARQLKNIKKMYPQLLEQYSIIGRIKPNVSKNTAIRIQNVEIQRLFENSVEDQNRYAEEFRKLINFADNNYTAEDQFIIQKFFKDLALAGFVQSGFNKSNISFTDLIPYEELASVFRSASNTYLELIAPHKDLSTRFTDTFITQFTNNNSGLVKRRANPNSNPWRGKNYFMSNDVSLGVEKYNREIYKERLDNQIKERDDNGNPILLPEQIEAITKGTKKILTSKFGFKNGMFEVSHGNSNSGVVIQVKKYLGKFKYDPSIDKIMALLPTGEFDETVAYEPDGFAIAEGFKNWEDFVNNTKTNRNFVNGMQPRNVYSISTVSTENKKSAPQAKKNLVVPAEKVIFKESFVPLTDYKRATKKSKFFIKNNESSTEVDGYLVTFEGHPELKVFVHGEKKDWRLSEVSTGFGIGNFSTSISAAIESGRDTLNKAMEKTSNMETLKKIGLATTNLDKEAADRLNNCKPS